MSWAGFLTHAFDLTRFWCRKSKGRKCLETGWMCRTKRRVLWYFLEIIQNEKMIVILKWRSNAVFPLVLRSIFETIEFWVHRTKPEHNLSLVGRTADKRGCSRNYSVHSVKEISSRESNLGAGLFKPNKIQFRLIMLLACFNVYFTVYCRGQA